MMKISGSRTDPGQLGKGLKDSGRWEEREGVRENIPGLQRQVADGGGAGSRKILRPAQFFSTPVSNGSPHFLSTPCLSTPFSAVTLCPDVCSSSASCPRLASCLAPPEGKGFCLSKKVGRKMSAQQGHPQNVSNGINQLSFVMFDNSPILVNFKLGR